MAKIKQNQPNKSLIIPRVGNNTGKSVVGLQNGAGTVENNEVQCLCTISVRRRKRFVFMKTYLWMFIAALFLTTKKSVTNPGVHQVVNG